jgi:hypothetical protein
MEGPTAAIRNGTSIVERADQAKLTMKSEETLGLEKLKAKLREDIVLIFGDVSQEKVYL